jgi:peptidoglycan/xylan/chitin deacetylase (PgdA/CDA1 family)
MRPPYGAITTAQKKWIREEFGYPSILWSVDPEDWKKPGSSAVTSRLVRGASPGGILLVHDIHAPTIDAIPSAVDQLLARGYQFVTVTQLLATDGRG